MLVAPGQRKPPLLLILFFLTSWLLLDDHNQMMSFGVWFSCVIPLLLLPAYSTFGMTLDLSVSLMCYSLSGTSSSCIKWIPRLEKHLRLVVLI